MPDKQLPFVMRSLPAGLEALADLALDLRWTWSHAGDEVWRRLDPETWELTENPKLILQSVSQERLEELAGDTGFQGQVRELVEERRNHFNQPGWCPLQHSHDELGTVAYFSMEYGLGEALPLYAGGLGVLAGDFLKTACDLNVPLVAVGLLYQEGYFRQAVDADGWQIEAFPYNDPSSLPIRPAIDQQRGWQRVKLELPGRTVLLRIWQAQVGRVPLYLLDSNDPLNSPTDRGITSRLYEEMTESRLLQEMVLGMGGWRLLEKLSIDAEVCHINEGHAAFVVLERARSHMRQAKQPFPVALWATRGGNIFTTHTAVAAGFDSFSPQLMTRYFRPFAADAGVPVEQILALGQQDPGKANDPFNMALLAMRCCGAVNGVSKLHEAVSRRIFQPLFPRWPEQEIPVNHITNGVHVPTWQSELANELWSQAAGRECWLADPDAAGEPIRALPDVDLWTLRANQRQALVTYVRERLTHERQQRGAEPDAIERAQRVMDPNVLTIGFARRFAAYKRPNLLLTDTDRLKRIISAPGRPVQLIAAGKAHPDDEEGKRLVQEFVRLATDPSVCQSVVYLEDYDIALAQQLVCGVDVWLNTPRRPWEACGTSGMKVLANGGLNFSELDGWWAEAYKPGLGWAIGDLREHYDGAWDASEANNLYEHLEKAIVPEFYERDSRGIPVRWVACVRESMAALTPFFSSNRMLRDYVSQLYIPATAAFRTRNANGARIAGELRSWQTQIEKYWPEIHFGELRIKKNDGKWRFQVAVYLAELDAGFVSVELFAEGTAGEPPTCIVMERGERLIGAANAYVYNATAPASRPAADYTPRIIPAHPEARVPLEDNHILWMR